MASVAPSASAELRSHWLLIVATTIGFSLSNVIQYSMGLFFEPMEREFGWTRTELSIGPTIVGLTSIATSPLIGVFVDRVGSRKVAILGSILVAFALSAFGLADGSLLQWIGLWCFYALAEMCVKNVVWAAAISQVFMVARGLALGLTMCGAALAQIVGPPLTYWLIVEFGWRLAFVALGFGWAGVVLFATIAFLRTAPRPSPLATTPPEHVPPSQLPGLTVHEALRSTILWRIFIACFLLFFFGIGIVVHQVPILTEAGVTRANAALLASLTGAAGIAGKLVTGYLLDRRDNGDVGAITLMASALGFLLLLEPFRTSATIVLAMAILGYAAGGKLQISSFLVSRYAGLRNFGKIFGFIVAGLSCGASLGTVSAGAVHDLFGSYVPIVVAGIPGSFFSGLLIYRLGRYPEWTAGTEGALASSDAVPRAALT